jgi:thiol-disulfide isomerase/thioredoxin
MAREPTECDVLIVLADISGYTRFILANQVEAVRGQLCISVLLEAVLREVRIPLQLQEIEGDAVFLYAANDGDEVAWRETLKQVRDNLDHFFTTFRAAMSAHAEMTSCACAVCANARELRLKIIAHSGRAVFHNIAGRSLVSGAVVILAHRLLKNSVPSHEYLLLTEPAYRELGVEGEFSRHSESYDGFGAVPTYVRGQSDCDSRSACPPANKGQVMRKTLLAVGLFALVAVVVIMAVRGPTALEGANAAEVARTSAPEFAPATEWLQSKPLTWATLRGRVVVAHFWTLGCINCIHNYPVYKAWQKEYGEKGVTIIGIHTPEFASEADVGRVRTKAEQNGLKFPIAVDNDGQNWKNWNNRYWPCVYLIDKNGRVRYRWEGELSSATTNGEQIMRQRIDELLAEKG